MKRKENLRKLRVFPIDHEVDSSGSVYMGAHLKIANGLLAPRLYFYDDTWGNPKDSYRLYRKALQNDLTN